MKKIELLIVDPQNSFCDPKGELFVKGADKDMSRLAKFIRKYGDKLDDIHVTLDSHQMNHIAHPFLWINSKGQNPTPFTLISRQDVENGIWNPVNPSWRKDFLNYVTQLEKNGRYVLCVWPPHCIIGSWGHAIYPDVSDALNEWAVKSTAWVDFVPKGSNPFTENYSALQADVPDTKDPATQLNIRLIETLKECDDLLIAGEALDFCVANSITDIGDAFGDENIKKFVLLEDLTSCVNAPGLEHLGSDFIKKMTARGMRVSNSVDFLK
jgi:nicotinamidase/pyrazinamidase